MPSSYQTWVRGSDSKWSFGRTVAIKKMKSRGDQEEKEPNEYLPKAISCRSNSRIALASEA